MVLRSRRIVTATLNQLGGYIRVYVLTSIEWTL